MNRILLLMIIVTLQYSCGTSKKNVQSYYYVEPFKEQEIKLILNNDSTFKIKDATGCNQFEFKGTYRLIAKNAESYLLFDTVKLESSLSKINTNLIFAIQSGDTAWIINGERLSIHKQPFKLITNPNINLTKIRYKKLEEYYIDFLGREGFIKAFGNGKGIKEAKKRLLDCELPDINIKLK